LRRVQVRIKEEGNGKEDEDRYTIQPRSTSPTGTRKIRRPSGVRTLIVHEQKGGDDNDLLKGEEKP
jgi:hypothetical protein